MVESLELYITAGIREHPSWVAKEQVCEETGSFLLGVSHVRCLTVTGVVVLTSQRPTIKLLSIPIALHKIKHNYIGTECYPLLATLCLGLALAISPSPHPTFLGHLCHFEHPVNYR